MTTTKTRRKTARRKTNGDSTKKEDEVAATVATDPEADKAEAESEESENVGAEDKSSSSAKEHNESSARDAYRQRMKLIGKLLNAAIEGLETSDPSEDRVGRGAYLHIIAEVFEALDGLSQAVPLDDLVVLSKIVAEQRRAELNTRKIEQVQHAAKKADATPAASNEFTTRRLPAGFGELVRQVYGTSFASDVTPPD